MSIVHLVLLIVGIVLVIGGAVRLYHRSWVDGAILLVIGLLLLGFGGFISA